MRFAICLVSYSAVWGGAECWPVASVSALCPQYGILIRICRYWAARWVCNASRRHTASNSRLNAA
ncbi:hypothetical protein MACH18_35860 [Phaeobacter italicus]|nr:hypothetical protein MACH18_35860 [Phaeobacter italicus]